MVKIGPKLPSPSKRELERIEKEQKRLAQLESGVVLPPVGEPRENLIYLPPLSKKRRVKHKDPTAIEQSKRKRAKKQKRALARRNAKNMVKEIIARLTPGSQVKGDGNEDVLPVDTDGLGTAVSDGPPTFGSPMLEVPITRTPTLPGSAYALGVDSNISPLVLGWSLLKSATNSWRSGKVIDQDTGPSTLSPVMPAVESEQYSGKISDADNSTLVASTPSLNINTARIGSGSFFDNEAFISGPSCSLKNIQSTQEIETMNKTDVLSPERHQAPLPSQTQFPRSVHHFGQGSELLTSPTRFSFRALPRVGIVSKPAIFSEPLDYSKYSSRIPSSARSSLRSQSEVVREQAAEQPAAEVHDFQDVNASTNIPGPFSFLDSRLPEENLIQPLMPDFYNCPNGWSRARGATVSKLYASPERLRLQVGGPSAARPGSEAPPATARASASSTQSLSPSALDTKSGNCVPGPSSSGKSGKSSGIDNNPPEVIRGKVGAPVRMDYSRVREPVIPQPIRYNQMAIVTHLVTPSHARGYEQNAGQIANSASFSSNISSARASEHTSSIAPADSLDANLQDVNQTVENKISPHMLNFPSFPDLTLRPLAPAAPIIPDKTSHMRILTDRVNNVPRSVTLDDLEKGTSDRDLDPRTTYDKGEGISPLLPSAFNIPQQDAVMAYPDTPPLGSRSGIVPPASTPVSRSPFVFAIALPTPPWSRDPILPTHGPHAAETNGRDAGGMRGFVLALKWALKKTFGYFWQRRG